jgi:glutamine amidotransferase
MRRSHSWLAHVRDGAHFYFVHSYAPDPAAESVVATTDHGGDVVAIVGRDGILGVQFHPEKSSVMGTRLLQGFVRAVS